MPLIQTSKVDLKNTDRPSSASDNKRTSEMDRRRYPRFPVKATSVFFQGPWYNRRKIKGLITDRSETGLCFETDEKILLRKNSPLRVRARFSQSQVAAIVPGTIVRNGFESNGFSRYGVRFEKILKQHE